MAVRRKYGSSEDVIRWYRGKIKKVDEVQSQAAENAVEYGAELMKNLIATRGTGHTWKKPWYGRVGSYPGRDHTGHMVNSVTTRVLTDTAGRKQVHFGWLNQRDDYFLYQEGGFFHVLGGFEVEGMYAMVDSAEEAFTMLKEELKRGMKGA